jgi:hypothetical protein
MKILKMSSWRVSVDFERLSGVSMKAANAAPRRPFLSAASPRLLFGVGFTF